MSTWRKVLGVICFLMTLVSITYLWPGHLIWLLPLVIGLTGTVVASWPLWKQMLRE
jgi:hypothetical protein